MTYLSPTELKKVCTYESLNAKEAIPSRKCYFEASAK